MKRLILAILFGTVFAAFGVDSIDITQGWVAQPVSSRNVKDLSEPVPATEDETEDDELDRMLEGDEDTMFVKKSSKSVKNAPTLYMGRNGKPSYWTEKWDSLTGRVPQLKDDVKAAEGTAFNQPFNAWYKRTVEIPADWEGRSISLEARLNYIALVVYVKGDTGFQKAGVALDPNGFVDLTNFLKPGKKTEIRIYATNQGHGTGDGKLAYLGRDDYAGGKPHFLSPVRLIARDGAAIRDVWVKACWRGRPQADGSFDGKRGASVRCEITSPKAQTANLTLEFTEDEGRDPQSQAFRGTEVAKTVTQSVKLEKGDNTVEFYFEWPDATPWELNSPFLYDVRTKLACGGKKPVDYPVFVYGYRDLWRVGRNFFMNGHIQHFRGYWSAAAVLKNPADMKKYGFNALYRTHQHESRFTEDAKQLEAWSRAGVAVFSGTPTIAKVRKGLVTSKDVERQFRRQMDRWAKSERNYPCVVGASVGVNMMCAAWWNMGAQVLGSGPANGDGYADINKAIDIAREYDPQCMYFAHGDGNTGDIGNCNFYFNWVPLQEREEWYSRWATRGDEAIAYFPGEFGAPYYGSWFARTGSPEMTEWLAAYYGAEAYEREPEDMLKLSREFAYSDAATYYGGWAQPTPDKKIALYDVHPMGMELHTLFVERVTRTWRAFGQSLAPQYLDNWEFKDGNKELYAHTRFNGDLLSFLGGAPEFTDKTHAYQAGDTVRKQLVCLWDGCAPCRPVTASWKLIDPATGKPVESGSKTLSVPMGKTLLEPIEFKAPTVAKRTSYRLDVVFSGPDVDKTSCKDSVPVDVYPAPAKVAAPAGVTVALFDSRGESAKMLAETGLTVTKVDSLDALLGSKATHLIVGRRALDAAASTNATEAAPVKKVIARIPALADAGKRILVLPQIPAVWQAMGLEVEDSVPRRLFNAMLPGVDDVDLSFWAGSPLPLREDSSWQNDPEHGFVQVKHKSGRGWRWTHTHGLALEMFSIPQRTAFRPLLVGECDLAYSPLLRGTIGKGAATLCSLDFEGRTCPAARTTLHAVLNDFLTDSSKAEAPVFTAGAAAKRLAETLGLDSTDYSAGAALNGGVLIVGNDAEVSYKDLEKSAKSGHVLVVDNSALAGTAGLNPTAATQAQTSWSSRGLDYDDGKGERAGKVEVATMDSLAMDDSLDLDEKKPEVKKPKKPSPKDVAPENLPKIWTATTNLVTAPFYRTLDTAKFDKFPFQGVGLQHLRWRFKLELLRLQPAAGWTVAGDGVFAINDAGTILFDQIPPFKLTDDRKTKKDKVGLNNVSQSQDNNLRRLSLVLENWGVKPSHSIFDPVFFGDGKTAASAAPVRKPKAEVVSLDDDDEDEAPKKKSDDPNRNVPQGPQGPKAETSSALYWSENRSFDPYTFVYW